MMMMKKIAALLLLAAGCGSATGAADRGECPRTREFTNLGCARVLAVVEVPQQLPAGYRYDVRVVPARGRSRDPLAFAVNPAPGAVPLQVTLWSPLDGGGDTVSAWIVARVLEDTRDASGRLTLYAADSVVRVVRFARVGEVPRTDTVRLTPR